MDLWLGLVLRKTVPKHGDKPRTMHKHDIDNIPRRVLENAGNHTPRGEGGGEGGNKCCVSYAISITILSVAKKLLIKTTKLLIALNSLMD